MAFPPLKDPLEGPDRPEDRKDGASANARETAPGEEESRDRGAGEGAAGDDGRGDDRGKDDQIDAEGRREDQASGEGTHAAPAPATAEASEQPGGDAGHARGHGDSGIEVHFGDDDDDDDLQELNEQVDFAALEDLEDLVEHRAQNAPLPPEPGSVAAAAAADIPMLTEVVQVPRYDTEDLPQTLAEVDWGDLGQRVRENVLERLLRRSDALLDAQLQNTLTPVLERAAETVAHELHDALNRMIRDIVARAVTEELTRLHAEIAKRNRSSRPS